MPRSLYLILVIHNHQPVGNFDFVFEEAYRTAYLPMIEALERHPAIRMALHYTGPLRDWLAEHHAGFLKRVRALVQRGQVEMLTGGYYEPVLAALSDTDKLGQIRKLTQAVHDDFGCQPAGAWLAERVWEPHLAKPLAEAGVEYTILDDTHFKYVGLDAEDLFGYYVTEEQNATLKVFSTSRHLRYTIPWATVETTIEWLRSQAEETPTGPLARPKVATMADDGEKFGLWPGTHRLCWSEEKWMERFFEAVESNADWLHLITPGEYAARFPSLGRVYLPTASYDELTEWALPAALSGEIVRLKRRLEEEGRQDVLRFVRGGFWRNFMVKYPEVNTLHKKMMRVGEKVHRMVGKAKSSALDHLWQGQCNCPYWHGVWGGIYLFHIRAANFEHLLAAEAMADAERHGDGPWIAWAADDFDRDAIPEILLESDAQNLYFDLAEGGSCFEWDWRAKRFNLLNVLSRRAEGYHDELRQAAEEGRLCVPGHDERLPDETVVRVKEPDLHQKLTFDRYRRASFLDHFLQPDVTLEAFARCEYGEAGDFVGQPYESAVEESEAALTLTLTRDGHVWQGPRFALLRLEKRIALRGDSTSVTATYTLTNIGDCPVETRLGVESNWAMLGGNGPGAYYAVPGRENAALDSTGEIEKTHSLQLVLEWMLMDVRLAFSRPATVWYFPIETISLSEGGFERVYQGSCVLSHWPVRLAPGESWSVKLTFDLRELPTEQDADER